MVTTVDLRRVLTEQEKALLSSDEGDFIDDTILTAAVNDAYAYVLSFLRTAYPTIPWDYATVPEALEQHVLTVAKYYLFTRRNLTSDALEGAMARTERFLRDVAAGRLSLPIVASEVGGAEAGSGIRDALAYDKVFLL